MHTALQTLVALVAELLTKFDGNLHGPRYHIGIAGDVALGQCVRADVALAELVPIYQHLQAGGMPSGKPDAIMEIAYDCPLDGWIALGYIACFDEGPKGVYIPFLSPEMGARLDFKQHAPQPFTERRAPFK